LRQRYVAEDTDNSLYVPQHLADDWRALSSEVQAELGAPTPRNVPSGRVDTIEQLGGYLNQLMDGGFRTCVYLDTGGLHAVGLIRLNESYFAARSTWTPFEDDDCVSLEEIYAYLDCAARQRKRPHNSRKTYKAINIVALPPEAI
jgi:hypothetical protein